jgi:hypothetical protein
MQIEFPPTSPLLVNFKCAAMTLYTVSLLNRRLDI